LLILSSTGYDDSACRPPFFHPLLLCKHNTNTNPANHKNKQTAKLRRNQSSTGTSHQDRKRQHPNRPQPPRPQNIVLPLGIIQSRPTLGLARENISGGDQSRFLGLETNILETQN